MLGNIGRGFCSIAFTDESLNLGSIGKINESNGQWFFQVVQEASIVRSRNFPDFNFNGSTTRGSFNETWSLDLVSRFGNIVETVGWGSSGLAGQSTSNVNLLLVEFKTTHVSTTDGNFNGVSAWSSWFKRWESEISGSNR